ncbi:MAG: hypothetical protein R3E01_06100 [Pirellulaceae bacterium]
MDGAILARDAVTASAGYLVVLGAAVACAGTCATAAAPQVRFDVEHVLACSDVTPPEAATAGGDEKLIETRFHISPLVAAGDSELVQELLFRIESVQSTLRVADFLPQTVLASEVAGGVHVERTAEQSDGQSLSVSGSYPSYVHGELGGSNSQRNLDTVRYELLPPQELLAASGTTSRGMGVYYKLHPNSQTSLEGAREYSIIWRVPRQWRGDLVQIVCQATGESGKDRFSCGATAFLVALHLDGDMDAKRLAVDFERAEADLLRQASVHRKAIERNSRPTFAHELRLVDAKIPDNWLYQVVGQGTELRFERDLPASVRDAVGRYRRAKRALMAQGTGRDVGKQL